jgi:hypothetical protein
MHLPALIEWQMIPMTRFWLADSELQSVLAVVQRVAAAESLG